MTNITAEFGAALRTVAVDAIFHDPDFLPWLRDRLERPELWVKLRGITFEQYRALGEADDPEELTALGYTALRTLANMPEEEVRGLIQELGGEEAC